MRAWTALALLCLGLSLADCRGRSPRPDPDNGGLFLPEGFGALVVADSTGPARHLAVNGNGDIYVKLRLAKGDSGNLALRDLDGDGRADSMVRFGGYPNDGSLATEMRIHEGYLYFSSELVLYRQQLKAGELVPTSPVETVLTDDHPHGSHWHITKPVAFDDRGGMYVPFGTPSNACSDISVTPGGTPGSPGLRPCPERELHGGIWRFPAGRTGLTQRDGVRVATGIRSVVGIAWNRDDGKLYAMQHGRDNLHMLWPDRFTPWENAILPAEELLVVQEGDDYGWPYTYYDQRKNANMVAPEYGGDGETVTTDTTLDLPAMGFPGHWAPNDILFYRGSRFPARYRNGLFIAFHGSTNRSPYPQAGYFVCFVPFRDGRPHGAWEVFADGFAGVDTIVNTGDARHRPMGLAEGPDGSLYVSDSRKGKIWRILYDGPADPGEASRAALEARKQRPNLKTPDPVADNLFRERAVPGGRLYGTYCASCHQRDGKGDGQRFPPLAGSDWVSGDKQRLVRTVVHGMSGPVTIDGKTYNNVMPGFGFLRDQDLSELLTHIRNQFGNQASPVTAEEVKRYRGTR
jgi:glucose/arabinose dehydrogenase